MFRPLSPDHRQCVAYTPPYPHRQRYINEDKIVPNTDNYMIFAILDFYTYQLYLCM